MALLLVPDASSAPPLLKRVAALRGDYPTALCGVDAVGRWSPPLRVRRPWLYSSRSQRFTRHRSSVELSPGLVALCGVSSSATRTVTCSRRGETADLPFYQGCFRAMTWLGDAGLYVNYHPSLAAIGVKSVLERWCTQIDERSATSIPRPATWVVPASAPAADLAKRADAWNAAYLIVKPANSSRGRGIRIMGSGRFGPLEAARDGWIVQELLWPPVTIGGHKIDCRAFVTIWDDSPPGFRMEPGVLVRRAPARFRRGSLDAELCNTSRTKALGRPVWIRTAERARRDAPGLDGIEERVLSIVDPLIRGILAESPRAPFTGLWALDFALVERDGRAEPFLLEVNPFPQIAHGGDREVDAWLASTVARWLTESDARAAPAKTSSIARDISTPAL